ncbi:MAG: 16S rRNA (guanine(527)-N(7))-methyltransferase RsmG [Aquificaceae bacterium]
MIKDIFLRNGLYVEDKKIELFKVYMEELKKWNRVHRLTGIEKDEEIIIRHFVDSLTLVLCFQEKGVDITNKSLCDVGSGAGFPGVPLKIYYGDRIDLTLIESVSKRCSFLEYIKSRLGLSYRVLCRRAEKVNETFDIVFCRALGKFEETASILKKLSKEYVFIMKGKEAPSGYDFCKINTHDIKDSYILFLPKTT